MILTNRTEEWRRRMRRYRQAQEQAGQAVRADPPLITVEFWRVPALYVRRRPLDASGWDALLQDQQHFRRSRETLDTCIRDLSRMQARLDGRPFGRLPQTLRRAKA